MRRRGSARPGRARTASSACCSRAQPACQLVPGPVAQLARPARAPRRRRARPAWRRRSGSRPAGRRPGRAAGCRARGRSRTRPGCAPRDDRAEQPLVGERQQVLDRAAAAGDHDHVDRRRRGRAAGRASMTSRAQLRALHAAYATSKGTAGQRRRAFSSTSRSAAEPRAVTSPTHAREERQRPLALAREQPLRRPAAGGAARGGRAARRARPCGSRRRPGDSEPRLA